MVPNPGMVVIGASGSGKSFAAKFEMAQWRMMGIPVVIVDPQNEYDRLCANLDGQFISLSIDSTSKINPLDFSYAVSPDTNALAEKIGFMIELVQVMLRAGRQDTPPLSDPQRSILETALRMTYKDFGYDIGSVATQQQATSDTMPILSDLYDKLQRMGVASKDPMVQHSIQPLIAGLQRYVAGSAFSGLFDHQSTVRLDNPFIVFNIQQVPEQMMVIVMQLVLEFIRTNLFTTRQARSGVPRLLYVDEAQTLMRFPETASFLETVARTARKFNVGLTVMTQDAETFLLRSDGSENPSGRAILNNCATTLLLRQKSSALEIIRETFKLTENEMLTLGGAQTGEGIVFVNDDSAWISLYGMASPLMEKLITTNAADVAQIYGDEQHLQAPPRQLGPGEA
jgi:type IV secretory pathway VirB4 component